MNLTGDVMSNGIGQDGIDFNQLAQMKQIEEMKKAVLGRILTKDAYERLSRVRSAPVSVRNSTWSCLSAGGGGAPSWIVIRPDMPRA